MSGEVLVESGAGPAAEDCSLLAARLCEALDAEPVPWTGELTGAAPVAVVTASDASGSPGLVHVTPGAGALVDAARVPVAIAPLGYASEPDCGWLRIGAGFAGLEGSSTAVRFGSELARGSRATLIVLTVGDTTTRGRREAGVPTVAEHLRSQHESAHQILEAGRSQVPDIVRCGVRFERGDAAAELRRAAEHLDVLVLGGEVDEPREGIAPIGDLTDAIEGMPTPVVVVPARPGPEPPSPIAGEVQAEFEAVGP